MNQRIIVIAAILVVACSISAGILVMNQPATDSIAPNPTYNPNVSISPEPIITATPEPTATPTPSPTPDTRTATSITFNAGINPGDTLETVSGQLTTSNGEPLPWHTLSIAVTVSGTVQTYAAKSGVDGRFSVPTPVNANWTQMTLSFVGDDQLAPTSTTKTP